LAAAWARAGDFDRAEVAAGDIINPDSRAQALRQLATVIASMGDLQRAESVTQGITQHESQVQALADLATAALETGNPSQADRIIGRAEAVARAMTNPDSKVHAFPQLATVAAKVAPHRSRRLLAEAINTEPPRIREWPEVVARFFPESSRDAADVFMAAYGQLE
jgi:lipopolysaccharide biosynthesis regulator YciM